MTFHKIKTHSKHRLGWPNNLPKIVGVVLNKTDRRTKQYHLHAGEIELHADHDISGVAVNLAARVEAAADPGAIYVSSTVRDLLLGSGTMLADRGEHRLWLR